MVVAVPAASVLERSPCYLQNVYIYMFDMIRRINSRYLPNSDNRLLYVTKW